MLKRTLQVALFFAALAVAVDWIAPAYSPFAGGRTDMPPRSADASPAAFTEIERASLAHTGPSSQTYLPSDEVKAVARSAYVRNRLTARKVWFLTPEDGPPAAVVILFHGGGRTGLSMIDMWRETAERHRLALVAPNAPLSGWPDAAPEGAFLARFAERAGAGAPVHLFGHSNGGRYAQIVLNRTVGPWRSAATHAGFAGPSHLSPAADAKPMRMYVGTAEHLFRPDLARAMGAALAEAGHRTELVAIPFHTHWFYDAGPAIAEDAWEWFAAQ